MELYNAWWGGDLFFQNPPKIYSQHHWNWGHAFIGPPWFQKRSNGGDIQQQPTLSHATQLSRLICKYKITNVQMKLIFNLKLNFFSLLTLIMWLHVPASVFWGRCNYRSPTLSRPSWMSCVHLGVISLGSKQMWLRCLIVSAGYHRSQVNKAEVY